MGCVGRAIGLVGVGGSKAHVYGRRTGQCIHSMQPAAISSLRGLGGLDRQAVGW